MGRDRIYTLREEIQSREKKVEEWFKNIEISHYMTVGVTQQRK